ncbi:fibronectin type III domain-containing protein [Streptomyces sp. NBC_01190]|uniref:fibronectin type III domain-containing protein n=1 Tax=Streptomyces sp. NBC_01190 TaxID=2903767 RepID=UPI00386AB650|nr:fibronectin type III domain-containing protein [Streptomyces sp. NBC_01190]
MTAPGADGSQPAANSLQVSWDPPLDDGGHTITAYTVDAAAPGQPPIVATVPATTSTTLTGLAVKNIIAVGGSTNPLAHSGLLRVVDKISTSGGTIRGIEREIHNLRHPDRGPEVAQLGGFTHHREARRACPGAARYQPPRRSPRSAH